MTSFNDIESYISYLIKRNDLPKQSELDLIIQKVGKQSPIAKRICQAICKHLKDSYSGVIEAWAAYKHIPLEETTDSKIDVVFVLETKDEEKLNITTYRTYIRPVGKISHEEENINQSISKFERENILPPEELDILINFVKTISVSIMKKHSQVTMISASWCKHSSCGKEPAQLALSPCVALYVPIKGYIPIDEDPFETKLGGYLVDVREGVFKPLSAANIQHTNLKIGCAITAGFVNESNQLIGGTLGPFVQFEQENFTYAITSAHVVLDHEHLKEVLEKNDARCILDNINVFHPVGTLHKFGQLVFASYTPGENGKPGLEIAVIRVLPERCPIDGTFPEASNYLEKGFGPNNPFVFNNGKCCDISYLLNSPLVIKYGAITELTEGKVRVYGSTVSCGVLRDNILGTQLTLYNQIEVESLGNQPFADYGDSGTLVLTRSDEGLLAVGILVGQFNNVYIVTPIKAILDGLSSKIGPCRLLPFNQTQTAVVGIQCADNTDNRNRLPPPPSNQLEHMQSQITELKLEHTNNNQEIHKRLNRIETMLTTLINKS